MKSPDVHYARNGGVSLAYQVTGEGPLDLMLVFGFISNIEYAWMYPSMSEFLSRLARMSRLILMDRRGSGLSDRIVGAIPPETMIDDIEVVLDEVGSPQTSMFGIWEGCIPAMLFAAAHPDRVPSLILFGASPAQLEDEDYASGWDEPTWEEWLASIKNGWGTRSWAVKNARWMGPTLLSNPDELDHWMSFMRMSASPSSAEALMRANLEIDARAVLSSVQARSLILHRSGDRVESIEAGRLVASKIPGARFVELEGEDGIPWIGDTDSMLSEVEEFLSADVATRVESNRRLRTVLFTDIVDSTGHLADVGDAAWRRLLTEHDSLAQRLVHNHDGSYVDSTGDGLLALFEGPAAAVRCALDLGSAVLDLGLHIRAGVHTAEVELDGSQVRGIAVHVGARIMSLAGPDEVLVSSTVKDLVSGSGLLFEDAGEHELKGVPDRWQLYRVTISEPQDKSYASQGVDK